MSEVGDASFGIWRLLLVMIKIILNIKICAKFDRSQEQSWTYHRKIYEIKEADKTSFVTYS